MADTKDLIRAAMSAATGNDDGGSDDGGDSGEVDNGTEVETTDSGDESTDNSDNGESEVEADGDGEPEAEAEVEPDAEEGTETEVEEEEADDEPVVDEFAKEHGISEKDTQGRTNRLPYPRVKKIAENTAIKSLKAATGLDLGKGKTSADYVAAVKTHITERDTKIQAYEERNELVRSGEDVMLNQPERFLEILPTLNPKYAELLAPKAVKVEDVAGDMPEPDFDLPNNQGKTYSLKGIQDLVKWVRSDVSKELDAKSNKQLKPILDERASREYQRTVIIPQLQKQVQHAIKNWKGFSEWQAEVNTELENDKTKTMTLADAYVKVRDRKHEEEVTKLKEDADKARKKVIADLKKAPKSTSAGGKVTGKKAAVNEEQSSADIIRNALKQKGMIK